MPTITPTGRAQIGNNPGEYVLPRSKVTVSTGMSMPNKPAQQQAGNSVQTDPNKPVLGQVDTKEDTPAQAVTLSPQLTALSRKQQKLQAEVQAQRDKENQWAQKEADHVSKTAFKAKLQQNAAEALKDLGVSYDELANALIAQEQSADPVKKLESKIQQLEQSQEQQVSKQYEATVAQYRKEVETLVAKDDRFITVREEKQEAAVLQHILDTFENEGEVLTVEEASNDIEDFLVAEAEGKLKLTKLKAKLPQTEPAQKKLPPPQAAQNQMKTLTQAVETSPQARSFNQFQHLSPKERLAQAIARAQR